MEPARHRVHLAQAGFADLSFLESPLRCADGLRAKRDGGAGTPRARRKEMSERSPEGFSGAGGHDGVRE